MKKRIALLTFSALAFITTSLSSFKTPTNNNESFVVKGKLTNISNQTKIILYDIGNGRSKKLDSAFVINNRFQFSGICPKSTMAKIEIDGIERSIYFILTNGSSVINGDINKLDSITFDGNKEMRDFATVKSLIDATASVLDSLNERSINLSMAKDIADNDTKILTTYQYLSNNIIDFVKNNPNSYSCNYLLAIAYNFLGNAKSIATAYNYLSKENKDNYYIKVIKEKMDNAKVAQGIGTMAKPFTQNNTLGKPISLESFKGKYVLVDFWASWCGPCRGENPNVARAYRMFKEKNFTVLGVSLDEDKVDWMNAIKKDKLTWTHVSDLKGWKNAVAVQYSIESIPQNMILDPTGKIIAKNLRGYALLNFLATTLGE